MTLTYGTAPFCEIRIRFGEIRVQNVMIYRLISRNMRITQFLIVFALLLFSGCAHKIILPGNNKDPLRKTVTIIHFNDGESHLLNAGSGLEDYGGIARFATVIKEIRADIKNKNISDTSLTLSVGNNILAGPVFNVSLQKGPPFYDAIALDSIEVDAFAIGSHDLDFGPDVLADFIKSFNYTKPLFLSANLDVTEEPALHGLEDGEKIAHYAILEKHGEKFGVIGLTTADLYTTSSPRNVTLIPSPVTLVQKAVDNLEQAGVNKIILLSNSKGIENEIALVQKVRGLDVVVAGGGNELLVNKENCLITENLPEGQSVSGLYPLFVKDLDQRNIPIVTTPGNYCYVGRLDLSFDSDGELAEILPSSKVRRVIGDSLIGAVEPDRVMTGTVVIPVAKAISTSSKIVGRTRVVLDGDTRNTRSHETNLGDLVADALFRSATRAADSFNSGTPNVAMINGGSIRQSIAVGPISEATLFAACPMYDFITIVNDVSPENFKALIESALSRLSMNEKASTCAFPQLSNMSIVYNPTRAVGERVKQIKLKNGNLIVRNYKIVPFAPSVNIATLNSLANGGKSWLFAKGGKKINIGIPLQSALIDYIEASKEEGGLGKLILQERYPTEGLNRIMITRE